MHKERDLCTNDAGNGQGASLVENSRQDATNNQPKGGENNPYIETQGAEQGVLIGKLGIVYLQVSEEFIARGRRGRGNHREQCYDKAQEKTNFRSTRQSGQDGIAAPGAAFAGGRYVCVVKAKQLSQRV